MVEMSGRMKTNDDISQQNRYIFCRNKVTRVMEAPSDQAALVHRTELETLYKTLGK